MFDLSRTRMESTFEYPVLSTAPVTYEGQCLQYAQENGVGKVQASLGASNNAIIAGFALMQNIKETTSVQVDVVTVPSTGPYTANLSFAPTSYTATTAKPNGASALTGGASLSPGAGAFGVSGSVIYFNAAQAGLVVTVTYLFNLTVQQAIMLYGDQPIGATAAAMLGSTTVLRKGEIYTNQFDTSVDWSTAVDSTFPIKGGANGRVTLGSGATGGTFTIARVTYVPTPVVPFLGLYINI